MSYKLLDIKNKLEWNMLLNKFNKNFLDIYFRPEYYEIYQNNGDGKALCFYLNSKYGKVLYPFLKNSINDIGYNLDKKYYDIQSVYGYGGCIYSNNSNYLKKYFHKIFSSYCHNSNIVSEFVRFHPILKNHEFSFPYLKISNNRQTILLDLDQGYEKIFNYTFSSNNRNMLRKANKILNARISKDENELRIFIKNYIYTMKKINSKKYYHFSKNYFFEFINNLKKQTYIINVYDEKKTIQNSMILLIDNYYASYHLSGRSKSCTSNYSNNFMISEAIKLAIKKKCKFFHLGGGRTQFQDDSLLRFKLNFSKKKINFYIGTRIHNKKIYHKICNLWEEKYDKLKEDYKNYFLKYRLSDTDL